MRILDYPELRQVCLYDCGACLLTSVLAFHGIDKREEEIMRIAGTTRRSGTETTGILRTLRHFGLTYSAGRKTIDQLRRAVDRGHPTLITLQAYRDDPSLPWPQCWNDGHWVAAIGYAGRGGRRIIFDDPASYLRSWLDGDELPERWHDVGRGGRRLIQWGCEVLGRSNYRFGQMEHMD